MSANMREEFPFIVEPDGLGEQATGFALPFGAEFEDKEQLMSARYSGLISAREKQKPADTKLIIFVIGGLSH